MNPARVKEIVSQYAVKPEDKRDIDALPVLLTGIGAGMMMLEKERALNVVERIGRYVQTGIVNASDPPGTFDLEQLADAIVAVEYYIETLQIGRSDPWYMLDNAEGCLTALEESLPAAARPAAPVKAAPTMAPVPSASPRVEALDPIAVRVRETIDPELLELFIEEAKEEIASIQENLPAWRETPELRDHVIALRRSFHTLKGSGRMVGAQLIGELAWSVENLLNRIINRTLPQTPSVLDLVDEVCAALPQLVEQLETGSAPTVRVSELIDRANALTEGGRHPFTTKAGGVAALERTLVLPRTPEQQAEEHALQLDGAENVDAAPPVAEPVVTDYDSTRVAIWDEELAEGMLDEAANAAPGDAAAVPAPVEEPMLLRIFRDEAATHLEAIRNEIEDSVIESTPHPVSERLFRSWHTLAGSARTAGVTSVAALAEPLCRYAEHGLAHGVPSVALTTMAPPRSSRKSSPAPVRRRASTLCARDAMPAPIEVETREDARSC